MQASEILHEATHPARPEVGLTPEQLEIRRSRVGGSEIGILLGLSPHMTKLDLYKQKVHGIRYPTTPEQTWGHYAEAAALRWLNEQCGIVTRKVDTIVHPEYPWACGTPDGIEIGGEHRLVEVKNVGRWMLDSWGDSGSDQAPMSHRAQVIWNLGIAMANGLCGSKGLLVPIFAGEPPNEWQYVVEFPERTFQILVQVARKFIVECVQPEREPEGWENDPGALEYVKERWSEHTAAMREPTEEALNALRQFRFAKERAVKWKRVEQMAQAKLCNLIGNAEGISGVATWKANKKGVRTLRLLGEKEE